MKSYNVYFNSLVFVNMDEGKIKNLSDQQLKVLFHFLNGRDTFSCLPTEHGKTLIYQAAVLVARTENRKSSLEAVCCRCFAPA